MTLVVVLFLSYWLGRQLINLFFEELEKRFKPIFSLGLGLLCLYPVGLANVLFVEGRQSIYRNHIFVELIFLVAINILLWIIRRMTEPRRSHSRILLGDDFSGLPFRFWLLLIMAAILLFWRLGLPDIAGDEREIGYRAYDLVDGIKAGRTAYTISFNDHAPLGNYIQHLVLNSIEAGGFYNLDDGDLRVAGALMALFSLWILWVLLTHWFSERLAFIAGLLMTVSVPFLFSGRLAIPQDLAFWNVYLLLSILSFGWWLSSRSQQALILSAIMTGAFGLVKLTGLAVLPVYFLWWYSETRDFKSLVKFAGIVFLMLSPVIIFNIVAFLTTGYVDIPTAILLRTLGIKVKTSMVEANIYAGAELSFVQKILPLFFTLADLFHPIVLIVFLLVGILGLLKVPNPKFRLLTLIFLVFVLSYLFIGFRAYYLTFTGFFLVSSFALGITRIPKLWSRTMVVLIFFLSFVYSLSSLHFLRGPQLLSGGEYGRSSEVIPSLSWSRMHSLSVRTWLNNAGWKSIKKQAPEIINNRILVVDKRIPSEKLFWYLKIDRVREHYNPSYKPSYRVVNSDQFNCVGDFVLLSQEEAVNDFCNMKMIKIASISSFSGESAFSFYAPALQYAMFHSQAF